MELANQRFFAAFSTNRKNTPWLNVDLRRHAEMTNIFEGPAPRIDDAIWAIQHWGVQGIAVGGYSQGNASDESKAAALSSTRLLVRLQLQVCK